jgi:ribonuclease Y
MTAIAILIAVAAACGGIIVGYFLRIIYALGTKGSLEVRIREMMGTARREVAEMKADAEKEAAELLRQVRSEIKEKEAMLREAEQRVRTKEESAAKREHEAKEATERAKIDSENAKATCERASKIEHEAKELMERIADMSMDEAKNELLNRVRKEEAEDVALRIRKIEREVSEPLERKAREIIISAIHRFGNAVPTDTFSSSVTIEGEEIKGRIIGKEGRNIKAFERMTGVDLIIDESPNALIISSHNPVRRQVAKMALEDLIRDGRIQPSRIEQAVEKATRDAQRVMKDKGEEAAYECGVIDLDPKLMALLGRLHYRTSYGQNVLRHSVEMSHIAGMIAAELGLDVRVTKSAALLHDIGKAVDHEVQGSHVEIGRRILQKFGVDEDVIKAMQAHHEEYPYETPESIVVQVADAISGGRPGARRDTLDQYVKRLDDLERIASKREGVERVYAISAGREIRVFVRPDDVDDVAAKEIARAIAKDIEREVRYPGEIKVTVIRESRVVEVAR